MDEEPQDFVTKTVYFLPKHLEFLKTIDDNNLNNAVRTVVNKAMNQTKKQYFERYINLFAFGIIFLTFALFSSFFIFQMLLVLIGILFIGYSATMITLSKRRKK